MITFKYETEDSSLELVTKEIVLTEILEEFERFLRGAGFFIDGSLEIVSQDEEE